MSLRKQERILVCLANRQGSVKKSASRLESL